MYNIAIIEDNLVLRKSLSEYFAKSDNVDCVLVVDSVEKFIKYHRDFLEIKLVLLDVYLNDQSSIRSIPLILQRDPDVDIVMFTVADDSETIFQALCSGATGYLLKDISFTQLEEQILHNLKGEGALLSPAVAKKIINYFTPKILPLSSPDEIVELSEKESIIVKMLKDGVSYGEIAQYLGISINGVRYYVRNIYRKLQIKSKGELWRKT